jgi:aryl-alcohol dehydrogenase-like predicted oxidoreductase
VVRSIVLAHGGSGVSELPRATLGRSGLSVTRLGYGSLGIGGRGTRAGIIVEPAVADRVLNTVLDSGIDLIDTAPDYGEAEDVIGRCISHRRDEYVLTSKVGCPVGADADLPIPKDAPKPHSHTRANYRTCVEQSLRRLRTDHLDLVQVHNSPSLDELIADDAVGELVRLRDEGKVRSIGMSATLPELLDHLALGMFDVIQVPYSALQPEHEAVITRAATDGVGVIVRGGVAQGSMGGAADAAPHHRQAQVRTQQQLWARAGMDELLDGMSPMEFMLRFTLSHPGISTAIVGTANVDHLRGNVDAALRGPLPPAIHDDARRRIELAIAAPRD